MTKRYGTHRTVYLIGKYAIKRPVFVEWRLFLYGLLANMQEARFWRETKWPELCPVVFAVRGGFLTVMRRAEPLGRVDFFHFDPEIWRERKDYTVPVESKLDSFGVLDGRIVAVDYGS